MRSEIPLRNSLLSRLLVTSVLISLVSIGATAWLTVRGTTVAIEQERGQALADDATVQDTLEGFAATHRNWNGVERTVLDLSRSTGRTIILTTRARQVITTSHRSAAERLPLNESAVIDPLHVAPSTDQDVGQAERTSHIDPRAVGPYRLPAEERAKLRRIARDEVSCLYGRVGVRAHIVEEASGRPALRTLRASQDFIPACATKLMLQPTPTEAAALAELTGLVRGCAGRNHVRLPEPLIITVDFRVEGDDSARGSAAVDDCVEEGRREQLAAHVAPAALLFVTSPPRTATAVFDLSPAGTLRVLATTGLVLAATIAVTAVIAIRLVRPLRALTHAARAPTGRHLRIPVTTKDETGYLAAALNDLSERRERTDEQRRVMVSDIAHELRTPLTNIRGWLDAAQDGLAEPDSALLTSLQEEAGLLQHIVDDLQVLAAADAGTLRLRPQKLDLRELIEQTMGAHRARADAGGVETVVHAPDGLSVHADPVRLRQVLGNLLSNAIRHTPPDGRVTLSARRVAGAVAIEVKDTGSGIRQEDLPRVFDRFWRAEQSRDRRTGGSGLGLSIVRQLVQAHGGDVSVASRPHVETVFLVRLPG
ncbi:putative two-component system sensor kinase [Streptomyces lincolnensis]|uniref:histidine kinase n=1 Tax=Streptomyces lincolnensis TaxID=1915 RepID=A0A1B1M1B3_STRLN|nr:HAMP domain-containing sensor histidine kinase [Streptomyces lincolnensis]ANS62428.1 putative two-component system sensor kinase [Streptomyces lincolnensis]AXG51353.1 putative two-component system sensor kinase [Streptomyces lincolnensis]QMV04421.1 HAMP domain-containing protein [Streptomyces lincolnensis]QMV11903.1 HAMP domain-containing protein [Streptomyces lincolnensis]